LIFVVRFSPKPFATERRHDAAVDHCAPDVRVIEPQLVISVRKFFEAQTEQTQTKTDASRPASLS
jgi:hypothetical protein